MFLPSDWGTNAGRFLVGGPILSAGAETGLSQLYTYGPDGIPSLFLETAASFAQQRIALAGFGSVGDQLIVANPGASSTAPRNVLAITPDGDVDVLATTPIRPFGLAFAPETFGAFGGDLFASSAQDGQVIAIDADGAVTPFATIPLTTGQTSLFQMEFSPAGFLEGFEELLFVSVRGSLTGGGILGDLVALNSSGEIVARLRSDLGLTKFDPRGLLFLDEQNLLVSDASDPILLITSTAFQATPEPSTFILFGLGLTGIAVYGRKRISMKG